MPVGANVLFTVRDPDHGVELGAIAPPLSFTDVPLTIP